MLAPCAASLGRDNFGRGSTPIVGSEPTFYNELPRPPNPVVRVKVGVESPLCLDRLGRVAHSLHHSVLIIRHIQITARPKAKKYQKRISDISHFSLIYPLRLSVYDLIYGHSEERTGVRGPALRSIFWSGSGGFFSVLTALSELTVRKGHTNHPRRYLGVRGTKE